MFSLRFTVGWQVFQECRSVTGHRLVGNDRQIDFVYNGSQFLGTFHELDQIVNLVVGQDVHTFFLQAEKKNATALPDSQHALGHGRPDHNDQLTLRFALRRADFGSDLTILDVRVENGTTVVPYTSPGCNDDEKEQLCLGCLVILWMRWRSSTDSWSDPSDMSESATGEKSGRAGKLLSSKEIIIPKPKPIVRCGIWRSLPTWNKTTRSWPWRIRFNPAHVHEVFAQVVGSTGCKPSADPGDHHGRILVRQHDLQSFRTSEQWRRPETRTHETKELSTVQAMQNAKTGLENRVTYADDIATSTHPTAGANDHRFHRHIARERTNQFSESRDVRRLRFGWWPTIKWYANKPRLIPVW